MRSRGVWCQHYFKLFFSFQHTAFFFGFFYFYLKVHMGRHFTQIWRWQRQTLSKRKASRYERPPLMCSDVPQRGLGKGKCSSEKTHRRPYEKTLQSILARGEPPPHIRVLRFSSLFFVLYIHCAYTPVEYILNLNTGRTIWCRHIALCRSM